jgi:hypothetical protein
MSKIIIASRNAPDVSYANSAPLSVDSESDFSVRIAALKAEIKMKTRYPTAEAARQVVAPFLRKWELSSGLLNPIDQFRFEFVSANIMDRAPPQGGIAQAEFYGVSGFDARGILIRNYPAPPLGLGWDADIELMFERFCTHDEKRTTISDAAYFCLTVLEGATSPLRSKPIACLPQLACVGKAATHFRIELPVLDKIGNLTGNRGGRFSRKKLGTAPPSRKWTRNGSTRHYAWLLGGCPKWLGRGLIRA